jgi:hypothetical protein
MVAAMRNPVPAVVVILLAVAAPIAGAQCVECPPDATLEDEPNCGLNDAGVPDDYVNGGCNSPEPRFTPIELGQTICGTTAVNTDTGARDTDWYELVLTGETRYLWIVTGEYRMLSGIVNNAGVPDCAEAHCFHIFKERDACEEARYAAVYQPGTYWLYVAPFFQDEAACEFGYTITVTEVAPADFNFDGIVGHIDFEWMMIAWGPCPTDIPCFADLDGDGMVGVTDFLILLAAWNE